MRYDHRRIERKWQKVWKQTGLYRTERRLTRMRKPQINADGISVHQRQNQRTSAKCYVLDMFPYPSGEGLHVGHPKGYIATDVYSRMKRMQGHAILHPMGWDAFGLPAENYAIQNKIHPRVAVKKNIKRFKKQLELLGFNYDWEREINTTDPNYYQWTQWIFLQLFHRGLAYRSNEPINWCPSCKTGLANEDLEDGRCERCGSVVEKRAIPQWVLRITNYADRLLSDLETLNWPEYIKESQRNWIGRSEGYEIEFALESRQEKITVFTTRPETILGVSFVALALDHPLASLAGNLTAINPANKKSVPVVTAEYVLSDYGFGAVMGVPAHDERDREFAKTHNLPVKDAPFADAARVEKIGRKVVTYKLRDWVFSRQRYWGEPIPLIHCAKPARPDGSGRSGGCGVVPIPEEDLPVKLPKVESYESTGTGESPLAKIEKWVKVKCPKCKGPARRETNTMPQWAGSCWYYLAYICKHNTQYKIHNTRTKQAFKKWLPVDMYVGGAEHATRHLIYARFWHKFLFDIGVVEAPEPFARLQNVGLILGSDGRKMSKRFGNVVNPDDIVKKFGADSLRVYEMFMGPFNQSIAWSTDSLVGARRFIEKVWRLREKAQNTEHPPERLKSFSRAGKNQTKHKTQNTKLDSLLHQTIKKVGDDIEQFRFNTAVSALMILVNALEKATAITRADFETLLTLLAPFAPHAAEELWSELGHTKSIHSERWPVFDPASLQENEVTIVVQVNGKTRGQFKAASATADAALEARAKANEGAAKWLAGKEIQKVIVVPDRLVNIVVA